MTRTLTTNFARRLTGAAVASAIVVTGFSAGSESVSTVAATDAAPQLQQSPIAQSVRYIVQARSTAAAAAAVEAAGGTVLRELGIINAVAASLTPASYTLLSANDAVRRLTEDRNVVSLAKKKDKKNKHSVEAEEDEAPSVDLASSDSSQDDDDDDAAAQAPQIADTVYAHAPSLANANGLHAAGIDGYGVTIAVIDSGLWEKQELKKDTYNRKRVPGSYDAILDKENKVKKDPSGHG
ncbi:MAG: hypothetical protein AAGG11_13675, partial [Pseudomonadota bacterium]